MRLFVTIHEPTVERALDAIAAVPEGTSVELRVDAISDFAMNRLDAFRNATDEELLFTRRSTPDHPQQPLTADELEQISRAGFDRIDVEWSETLDRDLISRFGDRVVLSHHDYRGVPPLEPLIASMRELDTKSVKIAVTPHSFREDLSILEVLEGAQASHALQCSLTLFGMGVRGLYSRILAPFLGSEMVFVARDASAIAAPAQLTLDQAIGIYGSDLQRTTASAQRTTAFFAVVGNPAHHSLSPKIHNRIFRDEQVAAAYSIIETVTFEEVLIEMLGEHRFAPTGISITAPFKEDAFRCAQELGHRATIGSNAVRCGAVNTLVRFRDGAGESRVIADNTDVDGFESGLARIVGEEERDLRAAVIGAGGTARAALVAAENLGIRATIYNRTFDKGEALARQMDAEAKTLDALAALDGEVIVNTTTAGGGLALPDRLFTPGRLFVDVAYAHGTTDLAERAREAGMIVFDGYDLLVAQARRQSKLFLDTIRAAGERAKC